MSLRDEGFAILLPEAQRWSASHIMKIPNTNLLLDLEGADRMGGRLWRLPPYSANTWHRHVDSWELYFLLEGSGRMRIGTTTVTVPRYGCVLVAPHKLRQVFNDSRDEALWLIVASPQEGMNGKRVTPDDVYPEDPKSLPAELQGKVWPPAT
jgi:mannose-6-phosphate isomerase-like protein (cupin superfamily)